ncbi:hypothetical protein [Klebsiella pneumoniae]|uniref:hypothetical protein n=1 Tax=Klebsiella pneumoniae TaxID=573 RepID=UPI00165E925D|nr:hypothetical protein [Klebsiella pneumoniae]
MSNLPEQPAWESGIHQLEESDRAKAGPGGVLNIPSTQLANRTLWLRAQVESVIDYKEYTFFKTESDPDGTISGLANTPDGKVFRVIQGPGDNYSFIYYLNQSGTAKELTTLIGNGAFDYLLGLIDALQSQLTPIQESPDALFDIVSSNGIRTFKVDDDNNGEISLSLIARLLTGDSGLNFNDSVIDNDAPDGWKFVIYFANGLVLCGIKNDGTRVGFSDGSGGGGGQSGGITPGDTAVGYDALRNYIGAATVRDVVGERISGRFVVDASDTSSPDDGGGVLVGVDGRRWVRQCDFVSWDMFGAPRIPEATYQNYATLSEQGSESSAQALLTDQEAADQAIIRCYAFARKHAIPVVQNVGRFLWVSDAIPVYVDSYLNGCTIVTCNRSGTDEVRWGKINGVNDGSPDPMYMFRIKGKERIDFTAAELNVLNTSYSSYLTRGSMQIPMPKLAAYRGGYFGFISSAVELYRSGDKTNPRMQVHYRDFTRIGRNGAISDVLVKNIPAGTINEAWIQPKEDSFLTFQPPSFFEAGNGRKFINIQVERSQVNIDNLVIDNFSTGSVESRVVVGSHGVTDIYCRNAAAECLPSEAGGAYVICFRNSIDIHVSGYYGLYGWGFQGHHGLKRVFIDQSVMNRFDFHSFGYDVYIDKTKFKGKQIYLQGGGQFSLRDCEFDVTFYSITQAGHLENRLDYFINMREDYAGDCECNLSIENHIFRFDRNITAAWAAGTLSFDVIRLNSGTSVDYGVATKTPHTIIGRNLVFDLDGVPASLPDNFAFTFCRPYRNIYNAAQKTYLPDMIKVQGMTAINVPDGKNAVMAVFRCGSDMAQNPFASRTKVRPNGTNAEIIAEDVISIINNPVIAQNSCPTVYMPGAASSWDTVVGGTTYRTSEYSYRPKVTLRNCYPSIINATGVKAEFDISGGLLARYSVGDTGNRCRVTGADIQLYPDSAGVLYFDSDKVRTANCDWFDPANGATYSGTLTGVGNENRGSTEHSPNI